MREATRYPGYSTLAKRDTPSWNDASRKAIDKRVFDPPERRFFTPDEFALVEALCDRIIPQTSAKRVPIANYIDHKMHTNETDGMQKEGEPQMQEVWRRGLRGLDAEARIRFGAPFRELSGGRQDDVISAIQKGEVRAPEWQRISAESFFKSRALHDIVTYYYGHPFGWDEIGFGGPASPRGYVRMGFDRRDPWDAVERK